ncbi:MAG: hydroxyacid dehydrogenase [Verrucomicrobia bacterium]|nr:hydroxyacid dehydrogenase [Verrucomicrobiota bacterium]
MPDTIIDVLITEEMDAPGIQQLTKDHRTVRDGTLWKDNAKLRAAIAGTRTIMIRNQTRLTGELLAAAPHLVGVGRVGVGLDNIDMTAASKLGVVVVSPVGANAVSVAELALGLLLALARKIPMADRSTKAGGWDRRGCNGLELDGKTLAICGFGRIGQLVAARARAFGLRLVVFDPFVKAESSLLRAHGATLGSRLEEALRDADFVTVHCPLTPETRHLFNAPAFAAMKPGAFFINTARGGIVDEAALIGALRAGQLGGAALDVREVEPPAAWGELEQFDNVILTPHIAAHTREAQTRTIEAVAADVDRLLRGEAAVSFVNFARPRR